MGATSIQWTDHSINPIRARLADRVGHYCEKVSPGCKHCYSSRLQPRFGLPQFQEQRGDNRPEPFLDPKTLLEPLKRRKPTKYFWCDMTDMFGDWVPFEWIAACFGVMAATPRHTHQVLTKRPERMKDALSDPTFVLLVERFRVLAEGGRLEEYFAPERASEVAGFPGYFVTTKGRVLSDRLKSGKRGTERHEIRAMSGEAGHGRVMLYRDGETERLLVHRIVLDAFDRIGTYEEQGCHIDGDATNNALWNLRWGTQSQNWDDSKRHGTRRRYFKLTPEQVAELRERAARGESGEALGRDFGISGTQARNIITGRQWTPDHKPVWPLPSVWLGVSAEDQQRADERIPLLLQCPAAVRFVSAEPLLGPIDLARCAAIEPTDVGYRPFVDWVIVGGESGAGARPFHDEWARSIVEQCKAAGVACFVKQLGAHVIQDGERRIKADKKGGDWSEWPQDLRVRDFPPGKGADGS